MVATVALLAASTSSIVLRYAAAFFFVVVAIGLLVALLRTARVLTRVDKLLGDLDQEIVPLLNKTGTTVDEVNSELARVNEITQAVVDMTQKMESMAGSVENVVTKPARKVAGFGAGVSQAISSFLRRNGGDAQTPPAPAADASSGEPEAATAESEATAEPAGSPAGDREPPGGEDADSGITSAGIQA